MTSFSCRPFFNDVAFGLLNLGMDEASVRERVRKALGMVNSRDLRDKPCT
jgi:energy-coupling factor transporter ATP-binding protein EcfA2